jgi:hypothetical protein
MLPYRNWQCSAHWRGRALAVRHRGLPVGDHSIALRGDKPVAARWDEGLAGAMSERGVVHEEGVAETLPMDLAASRPEFD